MVDYVTRSEVEKLTKYNIKAAVEASTRRTVTGVVEEMIEDNFTGGYDEQKQGKKKLIINTVEGALIDIVQQGHSDTILVQLGKAGQIHFIYGRHVARSLRKYVFSYGSRSVC